MMVGRQIGKTKKFLFPKGIFLFFNLQALYHTFCARNTSMVWSHFSKRDCTEQYN